MKGNWCDKANRFCQEPSCDECELYYEHITTGDDYCGCRKEETRA
jgi:hypothetical protein